MSYSYSSWERGVAVENDQRSIRVCKEEIQRWWGPCVVEKIEEKELQLAGIDYIAHKPDGTQIKIDVKVRARGPEFWDIKDKWSQDVMAEYQQTSSPGWAVNEDLETDFVLWVWPWMTEKERKVFLRSIPYRHADLVRRFKAGDFDNCVEKRTYNKSRCASYYKMIPIRSLLA